MSKKELKKRTIGEVINELSGKPMPFSIKVGDQAFNLFVHPASQEVLNRYSSMTDIKEPLSEKNRQADRFLICECVRDKDGKRVWEKPEDVKVEPFVYNQVNLAVTQRVFGLSLTDFSLKNL